MFLLPDKFLSSGISVAVITFGVMEGAKLWLESTGCQLPMYADEGRNLYKALGLKRSVAKVLTSGKIFLVITH